MISLRFGVGVPVKSPATVACGKSSAGGIIRRGQNSGPLAVQRLRGWNACVCLGSVQV